MGLFNFFDALNQLNDEIAEKWPSKKDHYISIDERFQILTECGMDDAQRTRLHDYLFAMSDEDFYGFILFLRDVLVEHKALYAIYFEAIIGIVEKNWQFMQKESLYNFLGVLSYFDITIEDYLAPVAKDSLKRSRAEESENPAEIIQSKRQKKDEKEISEKKSKQEAQQPDFYKKNLLDELDRIMKSYSNFLTIENNPAYVDLLKEKYGKDVDVQSKKYEALTQYNKELNFFTSELQKLSATKLAAANKVQAESSTDSNALPKIRFR